MKSESMISVHELYMQLQKLIAENKGDYRIFAMGRALGDDKIVITLKDFKSGQSERIALKTNLTSNHVI